MTRLHELIREYPELGEALAEFENRVSYLENSLPVHREEQQIPVYQDIQWTSRQWDKVQQLEAELLWRRKRDAETSKEIDKFKAKVDRGSKKYKTYE